MERSRVTLNTIALELVPPNADEGRERALEEARKVVQFSAESGLAGRLRHVMIPGIIAEDDDRPVAMKPKMDVLDFWSIVKPELAGIHGLCTQVTAFMDEPSLRKRLTDLRAAGMEGVVFVGVPRTMNDGEGSGVAPTDALSIYRELLPNRGVILIPTREGEQGRFNFKCDQGATYGMTQLLYSDAIVGFLRDFAKNTDHRPEILLSFGFVPKIESRVGLINWLIQDPGNAAVADEQEFVKRLARSEPPQKRQLMVDLYKRVIDGVAELGFPLSIHLEATYGVSAPAFQMFAEMLAYWSPARAGLAWRLVAWRGELRRTVAVHPGQQRDDAGRREGRDAQPNACPGEGPRVRVGVAGLSGHGAHHARFELPGDHRGLDPVAVGGGHHAGEGDGQLDVGFGIGQRGQVRAALQDHQVAVPAQR